MSSRTLYRYAGNSACGPWRRPTLDRETRSRAALNLNPYSCAEGLTLARHASSSPGAEQKSAGGPDQNPKSSETGVFAVSPASPALFGGDLRFTALRIPTELRLGRRHSRPELDLDADVAHGHLGAGDGAKQHQLVQIAQMTDAEQLARHLRQPGAEREIVAAIGAIDHVGAVEAVRHHDRAHGIGMPFRLFGAELEAPGLDCGARAGGQMAVAREHVVEPLLLEDGERLAQAVEERQGRRIGEVAGRVRPHMVGKIEIGPPALGIRHGGKRLLAGADDAKARRQHEALLRTGDGEIDAPFLHAEIDAG